MSKTDTVGYVVMYEKGHDRDIHQGMMFHVLGHAIGSANEMNAQDNGYIYTVHPVGPAIEKDPDAGDPDG